MEKYHIYGSERDRLKQVRKALNLTQAQMAAILGLDQSTYAHIERGKSNFTIHHLKKMVESHKLNPVWFMTGEGEMFLPSSNRLAFGWQPLPNSLNQPAKSINLTMNARGKNAKKQPTHEDFNNLNILVPVAAQAGYCVGWPDEIDDQVTVVNIPGVNGEARTVEVRGNSMEPVLEDGDFVVATRVARLEDLSAGKIHIVISSLLGLHIKYVHPVDQGLMMISANNLEHDPFLMEYETIKEIWQARLRITPHMLTQQEIPYYIGYKERIYRIEEFLSKAYPNWDKEAGKK